MHFWDRFLGIKPPPVRADATGGAEITLPMELRGGGRFDFEIVGESRRQASLERAAGGRRPEGLRIVVIARLVLEDENPADGNAVRVEIGGEHVGYLAREKAVDYRARLAQLGQPRGPFTCRAQIVCPPDRGDGILLSFGVWLDLDLRRIRRRKR